MLTKSTHARAPMLASTVVLRERAAHTCDQPDMDATLPLSRSQAHNRTAPTYLQIQSFLTHLRNHSGTSGKPAMTASRCSAAVRPRISARDTSTMPRNVSGPSVQLRLLCQPAMLP